MFLSFAYVRNKKKKDRILDFLDKLLSGIFLKKMFDFWMYYNIFPLPAVKYYIFSKSKIYFL